MVLQIGSRLRDMKRDERDTSFLLVQILARNHGCLASRIKRSLITAIFPYIFVSLCVGVPYSCGGSVILLPTGWFHPSLEHDLQPFTIRHVVVSPHPSLPGPDWRCLVI